MFHKHSRILIVDDTNLFRQMVKQSLQTLDFVSLAECADGARAFQTLKEAAALGNPFELVFSDLHMPGLDGIELVKAVRKETWGRALPIIMLTSDAEKEHILGAIQAGVSSYMIKPFTIEQVRLKMSQAWSKHNEAPKAS